MPSKQTLLGVDRQIAEKLQEIRLLQKEILEEEAGQSGDLQLEDLDNGVEDDGNFLRDTLVASSAHPNMSHSGYHVESETGVPILEDGDDGDVATLVSLSARGQPGIKRVYYFNLIMLSMLNLAPEIFSNF